MIATSQNHIAHVLDWILGIPIRLPLLIIRLYGDTVPLKKFPGMNTEEEQRATADLEVTADKEEVELRVTVDFEVTTEEVELRTTADLEAAADEEVELGGDC